MQYRFWDMPTALKLIREQYSWFLPTFEGYSTVVARGQPAITFCGSQSMNMIPQPGARHPECALLQPIAILPLIDHQAEDASFAPHILNPSITTAWGQALPRYQSTAGLPKQWNI